MKIDMKEKTMDSQNCIGDAFRGATWVSLHNGGGVGWGEVSQPPLSNINIVTVCVTIIVDQVIKGGFGLVLDGSEYHHEQHHLHK